MQGIGIEIQCSTVTIRDNTIANSGADGISVLERSNVDVQKNIIHGNTGAGLLVSGQASSCVSVSLYVCVHLYVCT
jgi:parallel beta-helix repeat protein